MGWEELEPSVDGKFCCTKVFLANQHFAIVCRPSSDPQFCLSDAEYHEYIQNIEDSLNDVKNQLANFPEEEYRDLLTQLDSLHMDGVRIFYTQEVVVEEGSVEEAKAEEGNVEGVKAEEGNVEGVKAEEGNVDEVKAEKVNVEEKNVDGVKVEEVEVEEMKAEPKSEF